MRGTIKVNGQDIELKDHVFDNRGYVLTGDSRGITIPRSLRQEVYQWAAHNRITVDFAGTMNGIDLWYVNDDADRTWFRLKWSR
jgi:hypothetical protein